MTIFTHVTFNLFPLYPGSKRSAAERFAMPNVSPLRRNPSSVTVGTRQMNPDKLFDYLDGKLSASERADFEARVISDEQLQRELAVARRIHSGMQGSDSREVIIPDLATEQRGRKLALRV